jgi:hypothetical protein
MILFLDLGTFLYFQQIFEIYFYSYYLSGYSLSDKNFKIPSFVNLVYYYFQGNGCSPARGHDTTKRANTVSCFQKNCSQTRLPDLNFLRYSFVDALPSLKQTGKSEFLINVQKTKKILGIGWKK